MLCLIVSVCMKLGVGQGAFPISIFLLTHPRRLSIFLHTHSLPLSCTCLLSCPMTKVGILGILGVIDRLLVRPTDCASGIDFTLPLEICIYVVQLQSSPDCLRSSSTAPVPPQILHTHPASKKVIPVSPSPRFSLTPLILSSTNSTSPTTSPPLLISLGYTALDPFNRDVP